MKRLAIAATVGCALVGAAFAANILPIAPVFFTETQPASRALPTGNCGVGGLGGSLTNVTALQEVISCSDSSQFTAGNVIHFFCDGSGIGAWARAATYNDYAIPTATGQLSDGGWLPSMGPTLQVAYPFGRWLPATVGAACSGSSWDGGVTVTVSRAQH